MDEAADSDRSNPVELVGDSSLDRLFASYFDQFLALVCTVPVGLCVEFALRLNPELELSATEVWVVEFAPICATMFFYFFVSEAVFSRTLGKKIFGLKVRSRNRDHCTVLAAALRSIGSAVELPFLFPLAALLIYKTPRHQRIGDVLAGTVVVRESGLTVFKEKLRNARQRQSQET